MADIKTYQVNKAQVINTITPENTRTYKAISHEQLINLTLEGIQHSGFTLDKEIYSMAREGNVANGRYTIGNISDKEMQIQIGWQNSLNKSISLKWAMGVSIFICSNGCISGDMGAFKKKHNGEVQTFTPQAIGEYIQSAGDVFIQMQKEREQMKQVEVNTRVCGELLGRMWLENEFLESTQLNIVKRELSHPTYEYGAPNSLWELYQFVTFSMKEVHPTLYMQNHMNAHKFFVEAAEIITEFTPKSLFIPKMNDGQLDWVKQVQEAEQV